MKRLFNISAIALALTVAFASCDKIESDNYLIFSGSNGTWYDGTGVENHTQRIFVEKYTGVRCVNCPDMDTIISNFQYNHNDRIVAVSIHAGVMAKPYTGFEDLRTTVGEDWNNFFGINDYPSAMLNRTKNGEVFDIYGLGNIGSGIDVVLTNTTEKMAMDLTVEYDAQSRMATIKSNVEFLQDVEEELTLTILIMEDGIIGKQSTHNGLVDNYVFKHVFRNTITDLWGIDVDADGKTGTCRYIELNYTLPTEYVAENCHIVGFISNKETKEVIQCAETGVTE